jgi:hypothetical protein
LEEARRVGSLEGAGEQGKLAGAASSMVDHLLSTGIGGRPGFKGAVEAAEEQRRQAVDTEDAIRRLVDMHVKLAAVSGFVTGLGGFVAMPVALPASLVGLSVIATRMSAGIAHLRGYDVKSEQVQTVILVSLLGSVGAEALKKAGIKRLGGKVLHQGSKRLPTGALRIVNQTVGRRLLSRFGQKGIAALPKAVPVAGGIFGATIDGATCRSIAKYAKKNFPEQLSQTAPVG